MQRKDDTPKIPQYYVVFNYIEEAGKGIAWKTVEFNGTITSPQDIVRLMDLVKEGTAYKKIVILNWWGYYKDPCMSKPRILEGQQCRELTQRMQASIPTV